MNVSATVVDGVFVSNIRWLAVKKFHIHCTPLIISAVVGLLRRLFLRYRFVELFSGHAEDGGREKTSHYKSLSADRQIGSIMIVCATMINDEVDDLRKGIDYHDYLRNHHIQAIDQSAASCEVLTSIGTTLMHRCVPRYTDTHSVLRLNNSVSGSDTYLRVV